MSLIHPNPDWGGNKFSFSWAHSNTWSRKLLNNSNITAQFLTWLSRMHQPTMKVPHFETQRTENWEHPSFVFCAFTYEVYYRVNKATYVQSSFCHITTHPPPSQIKNIKKKFGSTPIFSTPNCDTLLITSHITWLCLKCFMKLFIL